MNIPEYNFIDFQTHYTFRYSNPKNNTSTCLSKIIEVCDDF